MSDNGHIPDGPRTILNPDRIKKARELYEELAFHSTVADRLGVSVRTINAWINKGEEAEQILSDGGDISTNQQLYIDFLSASREGRCPWGKGAMAVYKNAIAKGSIEAAKFVLGKMYPTEIGDKAEDLTAVNNRIKELEACLEGMIAERAAMMPAQSAMPAQPRIMLHDVMPDVAVGAD